MIIYDNISLKLHHNNYYFNSCCVKYLLSKAWSPFRRTIMHIISYILFFPGPYDVKILFSDWPATGSYESIHTAQDNTQSTLVLHNCDEVCLELKTYFYWIKIRQQPNISLIYTLKNTVVYFVSNALNMFSFSAKNSLTLKCKYFTCKFQCWRCEPELRSAMFFYLFKQWLIYC